MSMHILMTSAAMLLIAGPAFADCSQEIESLQAAVTQAETGASSTESGLPATPHQEQVLAGDQEGDEGETSAGGAGQANMPASPHQQQVLVEPAAGAAGSDAGSGEQAAELIAEAGDMAEAGDEEGCMQKVTEAKGLLGVD